MFHNLCRRYLLTILSSFQWLKFFISSRKIEEVSVTPVFSPTQLKLVASLLRHRNLSCPLGRVEFTMKLMKLKFQDPSLVQASSQVSRGALALCSKSFFIFFKEGSSNS